MIHPSAIVHPDAKLADNVAIGAYSIIGEHVEIGKDTWIGPHAVITGHTKIGSGNKIYQFVSLGEAPQDKKYAGEQTRLEIGDRNVIREFCTFNRGTVQDTAVTRLGNDNWIMAYVHLAHDCQIGNHTIFANNASLAGHVHVGDHAILGGFTIIHQFCHIGVHSMTAMGSVVSQDVPPYVMAAGHPARPHGINTEGLKRRGFSSEAVLQIKRAYKALYKSGLTLSEAKETLSSEFDSTVEIKPLLDFLTISTRGIIR